MALGHPGHSHRQGKVHVGLPGRVWTIAKSRSQTTGTYVAMKAGRVQIRQQDDSVVEIAYDDLSRSDQAWIDDRRRQIDSMNLVHRRGPGPDVDARLDRVPADTGDEEDGMREFVSANQLLAKLELAGHDVNERQIPEIARSFEAFVKSKAIETRWDDEFFYVESNGIPRHQMMVGITNWQQQVPLPQRYFGDNAWRIPLNPTPAKKPLTTKNRFLRGAIAVAANGIPIFNPLNNRGEDAFLLGELDEFGGHCGRADDYHYHVAPIHLQKIIGKGLPIAYALDGYPIYGYEEPDGSKVVGLDAFNGHTDARGQYHYHATRAYPYLNGGFHGVVTERGGQVDPQPRAEPIRPDLPPLRNAKIVDFQESEPGHYRLTYEIRGKQSSIAYRVTKDRAATFVFTDPSGTSKTETYSPRRFGPESTGRRPPPPPRDGKRPER